MKKLNILIIFLLSLFIIYLLILLIPRKYQLSYEVKNFQINESYKDNNMYYLIKKDDISLEYIYRSKYSSSRKNINNIDEYSSNDNYCLYMNISHYPICLNNNEYIDYRLVDNDSYKKYTTQASYINKKVNDNITINTTNNNKIAIWNYDGIMYFNGDSSKEIKIFDGSYYEVNLNYLANEFLFIPNYDAKYNFSEVYVFNMKTNKIDKWILDYEISFDSIILGHNKNNIFLLDKKNKTEYKLELKKRKIELLTEPVVYQDGLAINTTINKLINNIDIFAYQHNYSFEVINNKIYYQYNKSNNKTLLSNKVNPVIISYTDDYCIYLIEDSLYEYNLNNGEVLLITNYEWKFNFINQIYVYK